MIDHTEVTIKAGDGGNGCVSFRREKFVPMGGPDGGDGGNGGSLYVKADRAMSTLYTVARSRRYRAESGGHGSGGGRHGRTGEDFYIGVPVGTEVRSRGGDGMLRLVGDLEDPGAAFLVARGGRGGFGNTRFATPTYQAPRIAERGEKGEEVELVLDLKLVADVGIIGLPNAGKSTLLAAVTRARPKVAEYEFTTVEPVLGVAEVGGQAFVLADIPGLVEGAHTGRGLGLDFLRHAERTRLLIHLVDGSRGDPVGDMETVNGELVQFEGNLGDKEQVVVVNKIDIGEVRGRVAALRSEFAERGMDPLFISAATGEGTRELLQRIAVILRAGQRERPAVRKAEPAGEAVRDRPSVLRAGEGYRVEGKAAVRLAKMMPLEVEEGRQVFWRRLARMGVVGALRRAGAQPGEKVRFGDVEVEWEG